jgi:hypothetical protein
MSARSIALSLPDAEERDHHGMPSFRVRGKIFATVPDEDHLRVMAGEAEIHAAVAEDPVSCREFFWGRQLACVVVDTRSADPDLVRSLLLEAWARKAPPALVREHPEISS